MRVGGTERESQGGEQCGGDLGRQLADWPGESLTF